MTTDDLRILLSTLDDFYPGRFSDLSAAELLAWRDVFRDLPLEAAMGAVQRWYANNIRHYAPPLARLYDLTETVRREDAQALARLRRANAHWSVTTPDPEALSARDSNTALYGQLLGELARRTMTQRLTRDDLAAQCQVWAVQHPQIAALLQQAARQFVVDGTGTVH